MPDEVLVGLEEPNCTFHPHLRWLARHSNLTMSKSKEGWMSLGDLQQMTMLAVVRLAASAYGARIREELWRVAGRRVSVPTVYVTLVRLEERGLVTSTEVAPEEGRGGRARRVFALTPDGWEALEEARAAMIRLWEGVARR